MDDTEHPFQPVSDQGRFRILDESGATVLECGDAGSAQHYATLLNQAYRRGYKSGYRAAKRT